MPTNITLLPVVGFTTTAPNNGDLLDQICTFQLSGSAINLTGIAFEAMVRRTSDDVQVLLDASTVNGQLVSGGVTGTLSWAVPVAVMSKLPAGSYVTDIKATADGHVLIVGQGQFVVTKGITR